MSIFTLQFGTYTFPNQTFEIEGHRLQMDTPITPVRRYDGGVVLNGFGQPKSFNINGKMFSNDVDTLHNAFNIYHKSLHNQGQSAYLKYRSDRQVLCYLAPNGIDGQYQRGLYEHLINVVTTLIAPQPCAESVNANSANGSRTNNSATQSLTNAGNFPTGPVFTFVAGTWAFSNNIFVQNNGNSLSFRYQGPLVAGQTLVVDCALGCVLLQVGLTMVDAISYLAGDLFLTLLEGANTMVITGATLAYTANWKDRWYI